MPGCPCVLSVPHHWRCSLCSSPRVSVLPYYEERAAQRRRRITNKGSEEEAGHSQVCATCSSSLRLYLPNLLPLSLSTLTHPTAIKWDRILPRLLDTRVDSDPPAGLCLASAHANALAFSRTLLPCLPCLHSGHASISCGRGAAPPGVGRAAVPWAPHPPWARRAWRPRCSQEAQRRRAARRAGYHSNHS